MGTPVITELGKYLLKANNKGTKTMSIEIQHLFTEKIRFSHHLIYFKSMFHFYTACKRQENLWFSNVFRAYGNGTLVLK